MTNTGGTPAGWYYAPGDPEGTQRYWDGAQWIGEPQAQSQEPTPTAEPPSRLGARLQRTASVVPGTEYSWSSPPSVFHLRVATGRPGIATPSAMHSITAGRSSSRTSVRSS